MLLGPVFSVEMVTMARRARYFVLRGLYGGALLGALWIVYLNSPATRHGATDLGVAANLTAAFFSTFSFVQLIAVLMVGPAMVAGTIALERERRTIEYLFTSQLGGVEIILNKLAARILQIAALLLAGLPILALAMLQGGIAPEALAVVYAITASTVVAVAAVSIAVSVWCPRAREAVTTAYLVLFALLVVPMVVAVLGRTSGSTFFVNSISPINEPLLAANPLWVLGSARLQASGAAPDAAWQMTLILARNQLLLAAAAVLWASFAIRRVHLRQSGKVEKRRRHFQLFRPTIGDRPLAWKELFAARTSSRLGSIGRIAVLVLICCVIGSALYGYPEALGAQNWRLNNYLGLLVFLATAFSCGMLLLLAARAAALITSEKERDTWDSLLSSPLTGGEILGGKLLGNLFSIRWGFAVLALLWGLGGTLQPTFLLGGLFSTALVLLMAIFVTAVGLTFSLGARSSIWAMGCTLGTCLFVGGGYLFCCVPVMIGNESDSEIMLAPCIPFLLAFPGMCSVESIHEDTIVVAFIVGVFLYALATVFLYFTTVESFDARAGRACPRPSSPLPQEKASSPIGDEPLGDST